MSARRDLEAMSRAAAAFGCFLLIATRPARAEVIHVPADYPTIQQAIEAAAEEGDEIIVAPETYNEAIDFLGKAIWLHSSGGPEVTIIDGAGLKGSVVSCISGESSGTTLEGFTITNGNAPCGGGMLNAYSRPTVINCIFEKNTAGGEDHETGGGGMFNDHADPIVLDCTFTGNTAFVYWFACGGGGMYNSDSSPTVSNCMFAGNTTPGYGAFSGGGGVYNYQSSPSLTACTFNANTAYDGGGLMEYAFLEVPAVVRGCTFTNNHASGAGGAMWTQTDAMMVIDCTFTGNTAGDSGGGMYAYGGMFRAGGRDSVGDRRGATRIPRGQRVWFSQMVDGCTFADNSAENGGGMCNFGATCLAISNCTFTGNSAIDDGGGIYGFYDFSWIVNCAFSENTATRGSAMYNTESDPTVADCLFTANTGLAAMSNEDCYFDFVIANCTFAGNDTSAIINTDCHGSSPTVTNCILWGDGDTEIVNDSCSLIVTYCDVQGGCEGVGNIDADPMFVDPNSGDYRLSSGSPCIDAGDNTAVAADEFDLDEDGDIEEPIPFDLDDNPRFIDDPDTEDTGYGEPPIVDMGAYEFQGPGCPADFDGDGDVDVVDLLYLLGAWGTPDGDVDGDGDTDTADLLALLAAWGECP